MLILAVIYTGKLPMPNVRKVIYYHQLSRRARRYALAYESYFLATELTRDAVKCRASSEDRQQDIIKLRELCQNADECVVIGGDGSVNIVANAIALSNTAVTVIPVGTGNDFARSQGISQWRWRMQQPWGSALQNLGKANEHYFVNHVGVGLSVDLMRLQPRWLKQMAGRLSYNIALLRYLFGSIKQRSRIRHQHGWDNGQIVALGSHIGGGILVNPKADRRAAQFACIHIPEMPRFTQLQALVRVLNGAIETTPGLKFTRGQQFTIGDSEHAVEIDGDCLFQGPATVTSVPQALYVNLPTPNSV